jgi:PKD repeat protein
MQTQPTGWVCLNPPLKIIMMRVLPTLALLLISGSVALTGQVYTDSDDLWQSFELNPEDHPYVPNNAYAGYARGERPIPDLPVVISLTDTGGVGDGVTDNTAAFRRAIDEAYALGGGAVLVPTGTWLVDKMIHLNRDGVVLRGEGQGNTIIRFANPLETVLGSTGFGTSKWNWAGGLIWVGPNNNLIRERTDGWIFQQSTPSGFTNGGPGHAWEYWFQGPVLGEVDPLATVERGQRGLPLVDATGLSAGDTVILTYTVGQELFEEIGEHALMQGIDYGSWLNHTDSFPVWQWPVEIEEVIGNTVVLAQPLRVAVRPAYAVKLRALGGHVRESGVEDLTIEGNARTTMGNNSSLGWNGLSFNKALNCWVRNVTIRNMENGFMLSSAKSISVLDTLLEGDRMMHHLYTARPSTHDARYDDFVVNLTGPKLVGAHGLNTEWLSTGNVWSRGTMNQGTFDSHRALSFDMLRTDITLTNNQESRPGGATTAGPFVGRRVTHWNVRIDSSDRPIEDGFNTEGLFVYQPNQFVRGALVGMQGSPVCEAPPYAMPGGDKDVPVLDHGIVPLAGANLYDMQVNLRQQTTLLVEAAHDPLLIQAPGLLTLEASLFVPAGESVDTLTLNVDGLPVGSTSTAPWQVDWNAAEGSYMIEWILRDSSGTEVSSIPRPMTVGTRRIYEDDDPDIRYPRGRQTFTGSWLRDGKAAHNFEVAELNFVGNRIRIMTSSTTGGHSARIYLDNMVDPITITPKVNNSSYAEYVLYDSGLIEDGPHTLRLVENAENLAIDYILVDQTGDPDTVDFPPLANFAVSTTNGVYPLNVSFDGRASTDPDGGSIVAWEWDFDGNGTTDATGSQVSHTYNAWGTFLATLTVRNNSGVEASAAISITVVEPQPTAVITATPGLSGPVPFSTTLSGSSSVPSETFRSITLYEWDEGADGTFETTGEEVSFSIPGSGSFPVRLRVTDDYGRTATASVTVAGLNNAPTVDMGETIVIVYDGQPVALDLSPVIADDGVPSNQTLSYQWSVLDGPDTASFSDATVAAPTVTFSSAGVFYLNLNVSDGDLDTDGTLFVVVENGGTGAWLEASGQLVMEAEGFTGNSVLDPSSPNRQWETVRDRYPGFTGSGFIEVPESGVQLGDWALSPEVAYDIIFSTTGTYQFWVRRYAPNYGGNSAYYGLNGNYIGQADNQNSNAGEWAWKKVGTVSVSSAGAARLNFRMREDGYAVDRFLLTLNTGYTPTGDGPAASARDGNKAPSAVMHLTYTSLEVPAAIGGDGSSSTDDAGVTAYFWDFDGDGFTDRTGSSASWVYSEPGIYTVSLMVEDAEGLWDETTQTVTIIDSRFPLPPVAAGNVSVVSGQVPLVVHLDGSASSDSDGDIVSWDWDMDSDGVVDAIGETGAFVYREPGVYDVTLTVWDNDGDSHSVLVATVSVSGTADSAEDSSQRYDVAFSSLLGGDGLLDRFEAIAYLSNGEIVAGGNFESLNLTGLSVRNIGTPDANDTGWIFRLTGNGNRVLSATRIPGSVLDLGVDDRDHLFIAAGDGGVIQLDPQAQELISNDLSGGFTRRIDVSPQGYHVALHNSGFEAGTVSIYDDEGQLLGRYPGRSLTQDVAIDELRQQVFITGFSNKDSGCNPVQVAYLEARDFDGRARWRNYDWPGTWLDDCDGDGYENNMADTRGYRVTLGQDGFLYAAFESAGGNHIIRRDPKDLSVPVNIVGGDAWNNFNNSKSEHKTVFARYQPEDGRFLLGQQLTARLATTVNPAANTLRVREGCIMADALGRVYITGESAEGLPIPSHPGYVASADTVALDPFYPPGSTSAGAFVLVMDRQFEKRLFVTRLTTGGSITSLAVLPGGEGEWSSFAFSGYADDTATSHLVNPIQSTPGAGEDGFIGIMNPGNSLATPVAVALVTPGSTNLELNFNAAESWSIDSTITIWEWDFNDDLVYEASGATTSHAFPAAGDYLIRLRVTDGLGGTSVTERMVHVGNRVPIARLQASPGFVSAPASIDLDASGSFDPDGDSLQFEWQIGDGADWTSGSGALSTVLLEDPGIYQVSVRVSDGNGQSAEASSVVTVRAVDRRPHIIDLPSTVIEAEDFTSLSSNGEPGANAWFTESVGGGWTGTGYLQAGPANLPSLDWSAGTEVAWSLDVVQAGTYRLWIRRKSTGGDDNSTWLILNNAFLRQLDNEEMGPAWVWLDAGTISLNAGLQSLQLRRRESAYQIDRFILSRDTAFVPEGSAPPMAARSGPVPPVASFSVSGQYGALPLTIDLDASASTDPDGSISLWEWDFQDNGSIDTTGSQAQIELLTAQAVTVRLIVTDSDGLQAESIQQITANPNRAPIAIARATPSAGSVPLSVTLDFTSSTDPDGDPLSPVWDLFGDRSQLTYATTPTILLDQPGTYLIRLQVTDPEGAWAQDWVSVIVSPDSGALDPPVITALGRAESGMLQLTILSVTGQRYWIESSTSLAPGTWEPVLETEMLGNDSSLSWTLDPPVLGEPIFYRVATDLTL